jgi:hypothetical protein
MVTFNSESFLFRFPTCFSILGAVYMTVLLISVIVNSMVKSLP